MREARTSGVKFTHVNSAVNQQSCPSEDLGLTTHCVGWRCRASAELFAHRIDLSNTCTDELA
jgi:hypothetical protein